MKNYCKNFVVLISVIILISCSSQKNVAGYYVDDTDKIIDLCRELILFENGTYMYKVSADNKHNRSYESSGKWFSDSLEHIYLTSERQFVRDFKILEKVDLDNEMITIKALDIKTKDILRYLKVIMYFKGESRELITDYDGVAEFYSKEQIDSIQFFDVSYIVENKESNTFRIETNYSDEPYLFLKNKKLIKKNKKLLWYNSSGDYHVLKKR